MVCWRSIFRGCFPSLIEFESETDYGDSGLCVCGHDKSQQDCLGGYCEAAGKLSWPIRISRHERPVGSVFYKARLLTAGISNSNTSDSLPRPHYGKLRRAGCYETFQGSLKLDGKCMEHLITPLSEPAVSLQACRTSGGPAPNHRQVATVTSVPPCCRLLFRGAAPCPA